MGESSGDDEDDHDGGGTSGGAVSSSKRIVTSLNLDDVSSSEEEDDDGDDGDAAGGDDDDLVEEKGAKGKGRKYGKRVHWGGEDTDADGAGVGGGKRPRQPQASVFAGVREDGMDASVEEQMMQLDKQDEKARKAGVGVAGQAELRRAKEALRQVRYIPSDVANLGSLAHLGSRAIYLRLIKTTPHHARPNPTRHAGPCLCSSRTRMKRADAVTSRIVQCQWRGKVLQQTFWCGIFDPKST